MYGSGTMNRRNLLLGLGTAATLSGAASVTGATFADSVTPTEADFRVIAEANVAVNGVANPTDGGVDNTSQGFVDTGNASNDGGVNFTEIGSQDVDTLPVVHADGTTDNDDLTVTLAFETEDATTLSPVLEIDNTGDTSVDVGVYFTDETGSSGFGADVTEDGTTNTDVITPTDVVETIQVVDSNGTQISPDTVDNSTPDETTQTVPNTVTVGPGTTEDLGIQITDNADFDSSVESVASGGTPFSGGVDDIDLIDAISIGNNPNTT